MSELFIARHGNPAGGRAIVLHGGPGAQHDYLLPQMLSLAEKRELIFYDQRGGGASRDAAHGTVTWETHVADLAELVAELNVRPLTLIGYSWGGLLALLYAVHAQAHGLEPPARLVLISPAPASATYRRQMNERFSARQNSEGVRRKRHELEDSGLRDSDPAAYRKRLFELSVMGYFHDPEQAADLTPFRVIARVQDSVWHSLGDYDILPALRTLAVPALVVHGSDDPIPPESSFQTATALGARFLLLEKCGHVPYVEQPQALFSAIELFLDQHPVNATERTYP
jgi:proline iminopeptidase